MRQTVAWLRKWAATAQGAQEAQAGQREQREQPAPPVVVAGSTRRPKTAQKTAPVAAVQSGADATTTAAATVAPPAPTAAAATSVGGTSIGIDADSPACQGWSCDQSECSDLAMEKSIKA